MRDARFFREEVPRLVSALRERAGERGEVAVEIHSERGGPWTVKEIPRLEAEWAALLVYAPAGRLELVAIRYEAIDQVVIRAGDPATAWRREGG